MGIPPIELSSSARVGKDHPCWHVHVPAHMLEINGHSRVSGMFGPNANLFLSLGTQAIARKRQHHIGKVLPGVP